MEERIVSLIGESNYNRIKKTTVLIVGLGGVGGYALESLVRSGIGTVILIDKDTIDSSNLNRQIIALKDNINQSKVEVAKERVLNINPLCQVYIHKINLSSSSIDILDNYHIDYIVDACDTVATKKLLIDYSVSNNIKLISSMGTAKKIDPSKLSITDIRKTSYDPLAKILRKYVLDKKNNKKIYVVSSTEQPVKSKVLASMVFVPATSGLLCANFIIKDIINNNQQSI